MGGWVGKKEEEEEEEEEEDVPLDGLVHHGLLGDLEIDLEVAGLLPGVLGGA